MAHLPLKKRGALWHNGKLLIEEVGCAANPWQRMRGLLGVATLPPGRALLIRPCRAVHTIGMRFPLDLLFVDRQWRVVRSLAGVAPGSLLAWGGWRAYGVLEAGTGWLPLVELAGAQLEWRSARLAVDQEPDAQ